MSLNNHRQLAAALRASAGRLTLCTFLRSLRSFLVATLRESIEATMADLKAEAYL